MSKLIIFDFDGTLADSMWAWDALGRETLTEEKLPMIPDYDAFIRTMSVPHFAEHLMHLYPSLAPDLMAKWHKRMVENYTHRVTLKAGAIEFLTLLREQGYILYLASATHFDILIQALDHFGLTPYFDFILTEERVGISKRDPKIYRMCMERAGVTPDETFLFEDAVHGLETAHSLGIRVCAVSDRSMVASSDKIRSIASLYVDDFRDTSLLLDFINS